MSATLHREWTSGMRPNSPARRLRQSARYYKTLQFAVAVIAFAAVGLATVAVINGTIAQVMTVLFSVTMPGSYARYEAARKAAARGVAGMM